jgi:hypothetical protein
MMVVESGAAAACSVPIAVVAGGIGSILVVLGVPIWPEAAEFGALSAAGDRGSQRRRRGTAGRRRVSSTGGEARIIRRCEASPDGLQGSMVSRSRCGPPEPTVVTRMVWWPALRVASRAAGFHFDQPPVALNVRFGAST